MRATDLDNPLIAQLKRCPAIAWDFDGTLIDSEAAPILHSFIIQTPDIRHVIVTFRTGRMLETMWRELSLDGGPARNVFSGLLSVPHQIWAEHAKLEYLRRAGMLSGEPKPEEILYWEWKGKVCAEHDLPVLVDDNFSHTKPGCDRFGIRLIHPDDFLT